MKKLTTLAFSLVLAISTITGCSSHGGTSEERSTVTTVTNTVPVSIAETETTEAELTNAKITAKSSTTSSTTTTAKSSTTSATTTTSGTPKTTTTKKSISTTAVTTTTAATTTTDTTTVAETTTAVVTKAEPVKKRVKLYVENIQQCPELPMGCEAVSGSIVLKWYGFKVDKFSLLPYQPMMEQCTKDGVWGDPNKVFVGNPRTYKWGCYSPVIKKAIEAYFEANKVTDYEVISLDGSDFENLYEEIDNDNPIILWVTTKMQDVEKGESWKLEDGSTFTWLKHEHCVAMIGYDTVKNTVIISDPYDSRGTVEYNRAVVEKVYQQLGNMALVIHHK